MTLKEVLIVACFAVLVNCYVSSRTHAGREMSMMESQYSSSAMERNVEPDVYERGIRQIKQGQEGQWRQGRYGVEGRQEERRVHGKREYEEMYAGQGGEGSYSGLGVHGRQGEQGRYEEQGNVKVYGRQIKLKSDESDVSSQEDSSERYEIMTAQKQYHNTDTEYAGNGRKVPNRMGVRSHKAHKPHLQDSNEMVNKIYKDM